MKIFKFISTLKILKEGRVDKVSFDNTMPTTLRNCIEEVLLALEFPENSNPNGYSITVKQPFNLLLSKPK
jgi:hypothetical protein